MRQARHFQLPPILEDFPFQTLPLIKLAFLCHRLPLKRLPLKLLPFKLLPLKLPRHQAFSFQLLSILRLLQWLDCQFLQ